MDLEDMALEMAGRILIALGVQYYHIDADRKTLLQLIGRVIPYVLSVGVGRTPWRMERTRRKNA